MLNAIRRFRLAARCATKRMTGDTVRVPDSTRFEGVGLISISKVRMAVFIRISRAPWVDDNGCCLSSPQSGFPQEAKSNKEVT